MPSIASMYLIIYALTSMDVKHRNSTLYIITKVAGIPKIYTNTAIAEARADFDLHG